MYLNSSVRLAIVAFLVSGCALAHAAAQDQERFQGRLSPVPIDGTTRAQVTGIGSLTATLVGARLSVQGVFEGLQGPATEARLHRGLAAGVRGTAILELTVTQDTEGSVSGSIELAPDQIESLRKGGLYVQIHSETAPEGNLWGWLLR